MVILNKMGHGFGIELKMFQSLLVSDGINCCSWMSLKKLPAQFPPDSLSLSVHSLLCVGGYHEKNRDAWEVPGLNHKRVDSSHPTSYLEGSKPRLIKPETGPVGLGWGALPASSSVGWKLAASQVVWDEESGLKTHSPPSLKAHIFTASLQPIELGASTGKTYGGLV